LGTSTFNTAEDIVETEEMGTEETTLPSTLSEIQSQSSRTWITPVPIKRMT
jgi:hypothetical protein